MRAQGCAAVEKLKRERKEFFGHRKRTVGVTNDRRKQQKLIYSSIAQSVEHAAVNRRVVGSSPT